MSESTSLGPAVIAPDWASRRGVLGNFAVVEEDLTICISKGHSNGSLASEVFTYRLSIIRLVGSRQCNTFGKLSGSATGDRDLVAAGVELSQITIGVGSLQAENLVSAHGKIRNSVRLQDIDQNIPQDVFTRGNSGWQRDGVCAVLLWESLARPRDGFLGIVSGLINLDPDVTGASREFAALATTVGKIGHDYHNISIIEQDQGIGIDILGPGWSLFHSVHMNFTVLPAATLAVSVTGTLFLSVPMLQVMASV